MNSPIDICQVDPVDILVITAHPDDAEFGASGTIARWIRDGKSACYVICTSGDKGASDRTIDPQDLIKIREDEQRAAAKVLGVREVVFLRYPDQHLEDTPEFRKHIVEMIRLFRPHTVVSTDPYRRYLWHRDHRIMGQVVMDAVFPFARDHMAYPDFIESGLEPHKVREVYYFGAEDINYYSDISDDFHIKAKALSCHESQVKDLGDGNFEGWLRNRCKQMAAGSPYELAEGFHKVKLPG
ncbi:MAG: PIG-L family deacetylase [Desulfobacteraceae bacterium]|nr:PIG-L family deacetylase [Desulfobacteraceae bacterium]